MSSKERNKLNWCWSELLAMVNEYDRGVSAGELAKWMGISRTTVQKYLKSLTKNKAAWAHKEPHWNGAKVTRYQPLGAQK